MRLSERDRLRATAEQLFGQSKLDLFERETLEQIRMDRAERIARERGAKKGWTEEQIQRRVWWRRAAREAGLLGLKALAGLGVSKAKAELEKRL